MYRELSPRHVRHIAVNSFDVNAEIAAAAAVLLLSKLLLLLPMMKLLLLLLLLNEGTDEVRSLRTFTSSRTPLLVCGFS